MVKSTSFQLNADEARATSDVVAGMCLESIFYFFHVMLIFSMILDSSIGTILVNGLSAHVLFDSEATRSFLSLAPNNKFRDAPGNLDSL